MPPGARSEVRAGATETLSCVPGLALSQPQGHSPRSRPYCARHDEPAGTITARIARARTALRDQATFGCSARGFGLAIDITSRAATRHNAPETKNTGRYLGRTAR